jgi:DNA-binding XRE family transcriptional regulator
VNPDHLYAGTHILNVRDKQLRNRTPKGETSGTSKITKATAEDIRYTYTKGVPMQDLALSYNLALSTIADIINGISWVEASGPIRTKNGSKINRGLHKGENSTSSKLRETDVIEIRRLYAEGNISQYKLAKTYNVTRSCIALVLNGKNWKIS